MWTASFSWADANAPAASSYYLALVTGGVIHASIRNYRTGADGLTITNPGTGLYTATFTGMPDNTSAAGVQLVVYSSPYSGSSNNVGVTAALASFGRGDEAAATLTARISPGGKTLFRPFGS